MDIFSPEKRYWIVFQVRGNSKVLEKKVFGYLRKSGIYFQKQKRVWVFIDSGFWHSSRIESTYYKSPLS